MERNGWVEGHGKTSSNQSLLLFLINSPDNVPAVVVQAVVEFDLFSVSFYLQQVILFIGMITDSQARGPPSSTPVDKQMSLAGKSKKPVLLLNA